MSEPTNFSERLKTLIDRAFKSPNAFAKASGISSSTLHNILYMERIPNGETLKKIAKATDVSLDWLLTGEHAGAGAAMAHNIGMGGYDAESQQPGRVADEVAANGLATKVDPEVLADVIAGVDVYLKERGATLEPKKFGEVVSLLYDIIIEEEGKTVDQARVAQVLRVAM